MLLDDSIGFIINRTGRKLTQFLGVHLAPTDITTEQWSVLARLCEEDGLSQKELSARVGKDQTNVTRILDQLERKGHVVRRVNPEDRRSYLPSVTVSGRAVYEEIVPIEEKVISLITEGISPQQLAVLKELLDRINDNAGNHLNDNR